MESQGMFRFYNQRIFVIEVHVESASDFSYESSEWILYEINKFEWVTEMSSSRGQLPDSSSSPWVEHLK